jgi:O-succinylbenzoic acid--CoA ligase
MNIRAVDEHPAVIAEEGTLTYGDLRARAARLARVLAGHGMESGDRVATTLPPSLDFVVLLHALPLLGAALVPVNTRLTAAEQAWQVEDSGARLVLDELPAGEEAAVALLPSAEPSSIHTVVYTSGTTGRPHAVELSHGNHAASAQASAAVLGVEAEDRWLCPLPVFHVGGLAVLLRCALYGTTAVLGSPELLADAGITLASLVPTQLARLRDAGFQPPPGLRAILLGGGPAPRPLVDWAVSAGLPVRLTYGMTEAASQIATAEPGARAATPLPGVELRIGPESEILVRGPMVSEGAVAGDGWLHSGDRGSLDSAGRLTVEGRLKNVIVTGGENVAAEEVERVLLDHPAVADAAVVGLPDPEWGEAVTAFVVLCADAPDLLDHARANLAPFKVPKRIEQVPGLPRNAAGKLLRSDLVP